MELIKKDIVGIICGNVFENLICKALETRPGELAKYMCGLANSNGGYIIVGVEKDNGVLNVVGFQTEFNIHTVMSSAIKKIEGVVCYEYGYVNIGEKTVFAVKVEKSQQKVLIDNIYYCYKNNGVDVKVDKEEKGISTLFISYTECDAPIVDIIEEKISEKLKNKVRISRYTELKYKDSFKAFMDTIQDHDFVLTVVSDTYLKSQACMYEVGETLKDHHYKDKLLFVVLSDNERKYYGEDAPKKIGADIYGGAENRLKYIEFWKEKYDKLNEIMINIADYEATSEAAKDLKIIGQIYRKDMGEFLQFLSDENGKSFQKLYKNDFTEIIEWIEP